ncbi:hypothetical protein [Paenibacillus sp.]|uniref:hypothetical protein n=1 Tax=Paenibacillus sp. TaxID=58172 RepID=UPI00283A6616|nr:hypothetical protein [Paenibacillus sp.]MDR0269237.1 hypothetical protein [Paenibacillus sp.]
MPISIAICDDEKNIRDHIMCLAKNQYEDCHTDLFDSGDARVLASEIKIDKGRGVDTTKKEEQLARIKEITENAIENMGEAIKDATKATQNISQGTEPAIGVNTEGHVSGEEKTVGASLANTGDALVETKVHAHN